MTQSNHDPGGRPRFRFTLAWMLLVMFVVSAASASGFYVFQTATSDAAPPLHFILAPVVAPGLCLLVAVGCWQIYEIISRRGR